MSFSSTLRAAGTLALWILLSVGLAACEFRPLYGQHGPNGVSTYDELGAVQIVPLTDRTGQQLHNFLRDRFNPLGQPRSPRYFLEVTLRESTRELALLEDESATRADLKLSATFVLRRSGSQDELFSGTSRSTNSYNILNTQFATQVSEQDARERGLREVAEEIRAQIALFLSRRGS